MSSTSISMTTSVARIHSLGEVGGQWPKRHRLVVGNLAALNEKKKMEHNGK
jgi:hypothetical protein